MFRCFVLKIQTFKHEGMNSMGDGSSIYSCYLTYLLTVLQSIRLSSVLFGDGTVDNFKTSDRIRSCVAMIIGGGGSSNELVFDGGGGWMPQLQWASSGNEWFGNPVIKGSRSCCVSTDRAIQCLCPIGKVHFCPAHDTYQRERWQTDGKITSFGCPTRS